MGQSIGQNVDFATGHCDRSGVGYLAAGISANGYIGLAVGAVVRAVIFGILLSASRKKA